MNEALRAFMLIAFAVVYQFLWNFLCFTILAVQYTLARYEGRDHA